MKENRKRYAKSEKGKAAKRRYYAAHAEQILAYQKDWKQRNNK